MSYLVTAIKKQETKCWSPEKKSRDEKKEMNINN